MDHLRRADTGDDGEDKQRTPASLGKILSGLEKLVHAARRPDMVGFEQAEQAALAILRAMRLSAESLSAIPQDLMKEACRISRKVDSFIANALQLQPEPVSRDLDIVRRGVEKLLADVE